MLNQTLSLVGAALVLGAYHYCPGALELSSSMG